MERRGTTVITGASGFLGRALAEAIGQSRSVALVDLDPVELAAVAAGLPAATCIAADLSRAEEVRRAADEILESTEFIDALVNNAAICPRLAFDETTVADFDRILAVNVLAPYFLTQFLLPSMHDGAQVINICSTATVHGGVFRASAYAASKSALANLTKSLARELAPHGIRVNAVTPGPMKSEMNLALPEDDRLQTLERLPMGRYINPEEVACVALFLLDEGTAMTGSNVFVDGGASMS